MNKGIFQSGSLRSCEKQSDIFHHIRYANTPRSTVPHKSMDVPKSLITLEDYREAERKLEKKLKSEGYGTSQKAVHSVAKGLKVLFFALFYIPFYVAFRLPFTILSILLSQLGRVIKAVMTPALKALDVAVRTVKDFASRVKFSGFRWKLNFNRTKSTKEEKTEQMTRNWKFWENWKLPEWKLSLPKIKLPKISLFPRWNGFKFSWPKWKWNPKPQFSKFRGFSWRRWNFLEGRSFKLQLPKWNLMNWKLSWKLPDFKMKWNFQRPTFSLPKSFRWDVSPTIQKWKERLNRFCFWKREKKKRTSFFRATAKAFGLRFLDALDEYVSEFPAIPQMVLRVIGRAIAWVTLKIYSLVSRIVLRAWKVLRKGYFAIVKVHENIQRVHMWTQKTSVQTKKWVDNGVETVARPVVGMIERAHSKTIPIRLRFRRWTFLAGIVVELSLVLLSETIFEFQEWSDGLMGRY